VVVGPVADAPPAAVEPLLPPEAAVVLPSAPAAVEFEFAAEEEDLVLLPAPASGVAPAAAVAELFPCPALDATLPVGVTPPEPGEAAAPPSPPAGGAAVASPLPDGGAALAPPSDGGAAPPPPSAGAPAEAASPAPGVTVAAAAPPPEGLSAAPEMFSIFLNI